MPSLFLYHMVAVVNEFKRESNESPCIARNGETQWQLSPPVSRTASLVRTIPCTDRERLTQRSRLHSPEESLSVERELAMKNTANMYGSVWMLPCLYHTVHLKIPPRSCSKASSRPSTLTINSFSMAANQSRQEDYPESGQ